MWFRCTDDINHDNWFSTNNELTLIDFVVLYFRLIDIVFVSHLYKEYTRLPSNRLLAFNNAVGVDFIDTLMDSNCHDYYIIPKCFQYFF